MPERERQVRAQAMIESIGAMLAFADQEEDYLLAAKLEDIRIMITERPLPATE